MIHGIALYIICCWLITFALTKTSYWLMEEKQRGKDLYDRIQRVLLSPIFLPYVVIITIAKIPSIIKRVKRQMKENQ